MLVTSTMGENGQEMILGETVKNLRAAQSSAEHHRAAQICREQPRASRVHRAPQSSAEQHRAAQNCPEQPRRSTEHAEIHSTEHGARSTEQRAGSKEHGTHTKEHRARSTEHGARSTECSEGEHWVEAGRYRKKTKYQQHPHKYKGEGLRIATWNVKGITIGKLAQLQSIMKARHIDILCI